MRLSIVTETVFPWELRKLSCYGSHIHIRTQAHYVFRTCFRAFLISDQLYPRVLEWPWAAHPCCIWYGMMLCGVYSCLFPSCLLLLSSFILPSFYFFIPHFLPSYHSLYIPSHRLYHVAVTRLKWRPSVTHAMTQPLCAITAHCLLTSVLWCLMGFTLALSHTSV